MEPRHEEKQGPEPRPEAQPAKPRRFRVVKLEERIAPGSRHTGYIFCFTALCGTHPHGRCQ
jgi:hypothetical protein